MASSSRVPSQLRARNFRISYIADVFSELRKVTWPTREEAWRLTITVIMITVAVGLILGGIDSLFAEFMKLVT